MYNQQQKPPVVILMSEHVAEIMVSNTVVERNISRLWENIRQVGGLVYVCPTVGNIQLLVDDLHHTFMSAGIHPAAPVHIVANGMAEKILAEELENKFLVPSFFSTLYNYDLATTSIDEVVAGIYQNVVAMGATHTKTKAHMGGIGAHTLRTQLLQARNAIDNALLTMGPAGMYGHPNGPQYNPHIPPNNPHWNPQGPATPNQARRWDNHYGANPQSSQQGFGYGGFGANPAPGYLQGWQDPRDVERQAQQRATANLPVLIHLHPANDAMDSALLTYMREQSNHIETFIKQRNVEGILVYAPNSVHKLHPALTQTPAIEMGFVLGGAQHYHFLIGDPTLTLDQVKRMNQELDAIPLHGQMFVTSLSDLFTLSFFNSVGLPVKRRFGDEVKKRTAIVHLHPEDDEAALDLNKVASNDVTGSLQGFMVGLTLAQGEFNYLLAVYEPTVVDLTRATLYAFGNKTPLNNVPPNTEHYHVVVVSNRTDPENKKSVVAESLRGLHRSSVVWRAEELQSFTPEDLPPSYGPL